MEEKAKTDLMPRATMLSGYRNFELIEDLDRLVAFRYHIEDARRILAGYIKELDEHLMLVMGEQGKKDFETGPEGNRIKVKIGKKATHKINDLKYLKAALYSEDKALREMARGCLAGGQSAWKMAQVRILADTLGLELVDTTFSDTVQVKIVETDKLKSLGVEVA